MSKIIQEISVGKYKILKLDVMPSTSYTAVIIKGRRYDLIPIYDALNCIAVESSEKLYGAEVTFE